MPGFLKSVDPGTIVLTEPPLWNPDYALFTNQAASVLRKQLCLTLVFKPIVLTNVFFLGFFF